MADFDERPQGENDKPESGLIISGVYHSNTDLIKALGKVLIQKGIITKAEVLAAL